MVPRRLTLSFEPVAVDGDWYDPVIRQGKVFSSHTRILLVNERQMRDRVHIQSVLCSCRYAEVGLLKFRKGIVPPHMRV